MVQVVIKWEMENVNINQKNIISSKNYPIPSKSNCKITSIAFIQQKNCSKIKAIATAWSTTNFAVSYYKVTWLINNLWFQLLLNCIFAMFAFGIPICFVVEHLFQFLLNLLISNKNAIFILQVYYKCRQILAWTFQSITHSSSL